MPSRKGGRSNNNHRGGKNKPAAKPKKKKKRKAADDDDDENEFITSAAKDAVSAATATKKTYKEKDILLQAIVEDSAKAAIKAKKENQKSTGTYRLPHQWLQNRVNTANANQRYERVDLSKLETDIKNKIRRLESDEKKRREAEKKRLEAENERLTAAVASAANPPPVETSTTRATSTTRTTNSSTTTGVDASLSSLDPCVRSAASSTLFAASSSSPAYASAPSRPQGCMCYYNPCRCPKFVLNGNQVVSNQDMEKDAMDVDTHNDECIARIEQAVADNESAWDVSALGTLADLATAADPLPQPGKCSHPMCTQLSVVPEPCSEGDCKANIHVLCGMFTTGGVDSQPWKCFYCLTGQPNPFNTSIRLSNEANAQANAQAVRVSLSPSKHVASLPSAGEVDSCLRSTTSSRQMQKRVTFDLPDEPKVDLSDESKDDDAPLVCTVADDEDDDNSIIRLSQATMKKFGLLQGYRMTILGHFGRVTRCILIEGECDNLVVRMNEIVRDNLNVEVNDTVELFPEDIPYGNSIHVAPCRSSDVVDNYFETYLMPYFCNQFRPVMEGDVFMVREGHETMHFKVLQTDPSPCCIVAEMTVVHSGGESWEHPGDTEYRHEFDSDIEDIVVLSVPEREKKNKGGRPKGSGARQKRVENLKMKGAINSVVSEYAKIQMLARANDGPNRKRASRVKDGALAELIQKARVEFNINDEHFDVPLSTIQSRIRSGRLEVFHPGTQAPLLQVEAILAGMIVAAWQVNRPLSVSAVINLMNSLVSGTKYAAYLLEWKRKQGMLDEDDDETSDLLGAAWYRGFGRRRPDLVPKRVRNLPKNRADQVSYPTFTKMFNQNEKGLVLSGNATRLPTSIHMDMLGNVVPEDKAFGHPVSIHIDRPKNVFYFDETGSNTHGRDDGNKGGEKRVVPEGVDADVAVGIKDSHFTVVPVTDATGDLVFVCLIFKGNKLKSTWTHGVNVFAELDETNDLNNFGTGKRYPGMKITCPNTGKVVPVLFAASPKASMTSKILKDLMAAMDMKGITSRGVDGDGKKYWPIVFVDGHISRMGEEFLTHINNEMTRWHALLGCPYGTGLWQVHDDRGLNGSFKQELTHAKRDLTYRKALAGLPEDIEQVEIVMVVREAIVRSFLVREYAVRSLARRGCNPFNRQPLDHPKILVSAPPDVQIERAEVLARRGADNTIRTRDAPVVPPTQRNLLNNVGTGIMVSASDVVEAANNLNFGGTAGDIIQLAHTSIKRNEGRQANNEKLARPSPETLKQRYREAPRFTSGVVFGLGGGALDENVMDEVIRRKNARNARLTKEKEGHKQKRIKVIKEGLEVLDRMNKLGDSFKMINSDLTKLCNYYKQPGDKAIPTLKKDLLKRYNSTKGRPPPQLPPELPPELLKDLLNKEEQAVALDIESSELDMLEEQAVALDIESSELDMLDSKPAAELNHDDSSIFGSPTEMEESDNEEDNSGASSKPMSCLWPCLDYGSQSEESDGEGEESDDDSDDDYEDDLR